MGVGRGAGDVGIMEERSKGAREDSGHQWAKGPGVRTGLQCWHSHGGHGDAEETGWLGIQVGVKEDPEDEECWGQWKAKMFGWHAWNGDVKDKQPDIKVVKTDYIQ